MELAVTLLTCADPDVNRRSDKQNGWIAGKTCDDSYGGDRDERSNQDQGSHVTSRI
jgi:hypothetical protein